MVENYIEDARYTGKHLSHLLHLECPISCGSDASVEESCVLELSICGDKRGFIFPDPIRRILYTDRLKWRDIFCGRPIGEWISVSLLDYNS